MATDHRATFAGIKRFDQLVRYLKDPMGWPIEGSDFEELTFEYTPEELGIDAANAAKIQEIKRLRPLSASQPWGIFFVKFEPKRLPVVALRRILSQVALKKRASANNAERAAWAADDLLFISNYGEGDERQISFAHFSQPRERNDLPTLKVLGWDNLDTASHLDAVAHELTQHLSWPDDDTDAKAWRQRWRGAFTLRHREVITTSMGLSIRLAKLARDICERIKSALAIESARGPLTKLMTAFRESLVHDLDADGFADMYAQTIAYGLLSARIADPTRKTADDFAAHMRTSPFLRELMETFLHIGGRRGKAGGPGIDFDELGVSEVTALLDEANMEAVVRDFGDRNRQEDPVIHFYELFLTAYDKQKKIQRGVFYTPQPVVSYIVRSVHELLQTEFGLADGLADTTTWGEMLKKHPGLKLPPLTDEPGEKRSISPDEPFVQILDPATGTATFLVEVIDVIHRTLAAKWKKLRLNDTQQSAAWNDYVPKHLLPRLHAFELMMAPYAIAHMKIGLKLAETGYRFGSEERARIYLANALEPWVKQLPLHGFDALAHEAAEVNQIKRLTRFTVVIGNPPYSISSSNMGSWITALCEDYKKTIRLEERQIQAVSDDYVKFVRLAHHHILQSHFGVIGLITNNGYLRGLLFRDMRRSLVENFEAHLVDLHGSGRPGASRAQATDDENVFDIIQGVAVLLLSRANDSLPKSATVSLCDMTGSRLLKYARLASESISSSRFTSIEPAAPMWMFGGGTLQAEEYTLWQSILKCFGSGNPDADRHVHYGAGFVSQQDEFAIGFTARDVYDHIEELLSDGMTEQTLRERFRLCSTEQWSYQRARKELREANWRRAASRILYRPFDFRWTVLNRNVVSILRRRIMMHLTRPNLALCVGRQGQAVSGADWSLAFCTDRPEDYNLFARGNNLCIPLFLFSNDNEETMRLHGNRPAVTRVPNISPETMRTFRKAKLVSNDDEEAAVAIFRFIYAVLHSLSYRRRYQLQLDSDFPRLPPIANIQLFRILVKLGGELVDQHLLNAHKCDAGKIEFVGGHGAGIEVTKISWSRDTVWVDKAQTTGFKGVREDVWSFHIGGYQVCEKWLKDRKGRTLTKDDLAHYQKIVVALTETIRLMAEIDKVIDKHGGWPGAFSARTEAVVQ